MKTIITLFFYIFLMVSNVFFLLRSEENANSVVLEEKGLICQKDFTFNPEVFHWNFIK